MTGSLPILYGRLLQGFLIAFVGREINVKNIQKTNKLCYCLRGKFKTLRGEISPPKGPEKKNTVLFDHGIQTLAFD